MCFRGWRLQEMYKSVGGDNRVVEGGDGLKY